MKKYIFYIGRYFTVEFFRNKKGEMPAKKYFKQLNYDERKKMAALVKLIADHREIRNVSKFRYVSPKYKIFEFKPKAHRFFSFFCVDKKIILTNAYRKKSQKLDQKELNTAIKHKKDYENRCQKGEYYNDKENE